MNRSIACVLVTAALSGACRTAASGGNGNADAALPDDTGVRTDAVTADRVVSDVVATDQPPLADLPALTDAPTPTDVGAPPIDGALSGLGAARAAITGSGAITLNVPVTELVVTRLVAATPGADGGVSANDPAGFFVQEGRTGPAAFVAVAPSTLTPALQLGDRVAFTITEGRVSGGARWITGITGLMRLGGVSELSALTQDLSAATDIVTALSDYESELVRVNVTVAAAFTSAGVGFESAQITTAGVPMAIAGLRLRLRSELRMARGLRVGCSATVTAPLWRFNTQAQVHAWADADLSSVSCPPEMDAGTLDAGPRDAGTLDAGPRDAGPLDVGSTSPDVPSVDAGAEADPTEVWVVRLGTGAGSLSSAATAAFIERVRISDGMNAADPIALPAAMTGSNNPISFSATSDSEGTLTRSLDRRYVTLAGYAVAPGSATGSVTSTTSPRVIARVAADGSVNTSTVLGTAFSGTAVRGAVTVDGTAFFAFGQSTQGGVFAATLGGSTATPTVTAPNNVRFAALYDSALYGTVSLSGAYGVFRVEGSVGTLLPGFPTATGPSRYGFVAFDRDVTPGIDTIYQCDDGAVSTSSGQGGVYKHTLRAGTWSATGPYRAGLSTGCRSITGFASGTSVTLLITSGDSANRIFRAVDSGAAPEATMWTEIRRAASNTAYRGITLAPR